MRTFFDIESEETLTIVELEAEYNELKANNETEAETFADYLTNCLSKNGTLQEV